MRHSSSCSIDFLEETKTEFYGYNGYFDAIKDHDTAQVRTGWTIKLENFCLYKNEHKQTKTSAHTVEILFSFILSKN